MRLLFKVLDLVFWVLLALIVGAVVFLKHKTGS